MRDRAVGALRRSPGAAAATGMAVLMVTGCNGAGTPDVKATRSQATTAATSTATVTPSASRTRVETIAERDGRLAGEAVVRYWAVVDDLAANPTKSLNLLDPVARDQARAQRQYVLGTYSAKGWLQEGKVKLTDVKATTKDGKAFVVTACVDVRAVDLVDKDGNSQVDPKRPKAWRYSYTVVKDSQVFVVTKDMLEGKPC